MFVFVLPVKRKKKMLWSTLFQHARDENVLLSSLLIMSRASKKQSQQPCIKKNPQFKWNNVFHFEGRSLRFISSFCAKRKDKTFVCIFRRQKVDMLLSCWTQRRKKSVFLIQKRHRFTHNWNEMLQLSSSSHFAAKIVLALGCAIHGRFFWSNNKRRINWNCEGFIVCALIFRIARINLNVSVWDVKNCKRKQNAVWKRDTYCLFVS